MLGNQGRQLARLGRRQAVAQTRLVARAVLVTPTQGGVRNHSQSTAGVSRNMNRHKLLSQEITSGSWVRNMSSFPPHTRVTLPALSPTMEVGTIINWEKKVGDKISEGDILCEIETDKATMGFETPDEGYLAKIIFEAGSKDIPVGKLVCIIVEDEAEVAEFADFVDSGAPAAAAAVAAPPAAAAVESNFPPHIRVTLPALSPTMEFGTIVNWEKKEGDKISEGDLLCEIETDKATMGFETPEEGYLAKIIFEAGSKDIPIGKLLCIIVEDKANLGKFGDFVDLGPSQVASAPAPAAAAAPAPTAASPPQAAQAPTRSAAPRGGDRVFASPAAKRVAAEKGVDLGSIKTGSGMDGMITSKDVENFVPASVVPVSLSSFPAASPQDLAGMGAFTDAEASSMRKVIAKRLQKSKHEIPHYYLTVECRMDNIMNLRKDINATYEKEGVKLSVNDFIIKAVALASKRVPDCNSAWMETFIRTFHTCDVSVAVDTGNGLITPIVTGVESKGLAEISESIKELAGRAKLGKLAPHEYQGGTITVSNLGMFGINQFTAIINQPQACILAVGGTEKKVVPSKEGAVEVANMMRVTLSCDHRVVDGAVGAQWLQHFKKFMENPQAMLL